MPEHGYFYEKSNEYRKINWINKVRVGFESA